MRIYGNSYRGRVYTFKVTDIRELETGEIIVWITNQENYRESKLNPLYIGCPCGKVHIGDIITRQYTREGVGLYGGMGGGYSSEGTTTYYNHTSEERYKATRSVGNIPWMGVGVVAIIFWIIFLLTNY